ncbi:MAG: hypothetical protein ABFC96_15400 [Thermoguttaceae bacterium]
MRHVGFVLVVLMMAAKTVLAEVKLDDKTVVSFASVDQGKKVLASRDDFVRRLSPFDRASRLKTDEDVSEEAYLKFVANNVLEWNESERSLLSAAVSDISPQLKQLALPWPEKVIVIKTTGKEEGDSAYTRANAIVFPRSLLEPYQDVGQMFRHELFHILSRQNPALRDDLYRVIGFEKCKEIEFPTEYAKRRITNPDAPLNDHCIQVRANGNAIWAMPVLYARGDYDAARGGDFFNYMTLRLVVVAEGDTSRPQHWVYDPRRPRMCGLDDVSGLVEQVGRNTGYIIHPEEILAENFVLLLSDRKHPSSPEILDKMKAVLAKHSRNPNRK